MSQGVTIDIKTRLVGYEASLRQMEQAFAKIDPGSSIGRELKKVIESANTQLKALSKNLSPKVTSDNQIDAVIGKVNNLGETVQRVASLMQGIDVKDLNLNLFADEFAQLQNQITALENELENNFTKGIKHTITHSKALKQSFDDLGIDASKMSRGEIFDALNDKAEQLNKTIKDTDKNIEGLNKQINTKNAKIEEQRNGLFGTVESKDNLKNQVEEYKNQYIAIFSDLKTKITEGLKKKIGENDSIDQESLINTFFGGLNPDNLKDKINELYSSLSKDKIYTKGQKTDFYKDIFDFDGDINGLIKNLNLGDTTAIREGFKQLIQSIASEIGGGAAQVDIELIDKGQLEKAGDKALKEIDTTYKRVQDSIQKNSDEVDKLTKDKIAEETVKQNAETQQSTIEAVKKQLERRVEVLEKQNSDLREQITSLRNQIEGKKQAAAEQVRLEGEKSLISTEEFQISTSEALKYKQALEQVQEREQLVGRIQGVVQRWFSIYAAVRMVNKAIRSVISTIQELDKTITEIAIVTSMNQSDLWGQMSSYTDMARQYAASISGVYKVSQLYYQQGLQTAEVMALTEQTLKMARISGLDYAEATNFMTNAIRSFKMEMTEAQRVVDVYSAVAAASATDTTELAKAMSKTASSAEAVGSSFENTTAMMAVMIGNTVPYNRKIILNPEYAGNSLELFLLNQYSDVLAA